MTTSLDRKLEASRARAAAEAKARGQTPDQFHTGNHANPDGSQTYVPPPAPPSPPPAPLPIQWCWRSPKGWYDGRDPSTIYQTQNDMRPADDLSNVVSTETEIGKTHVDTPRKA